MQHCDCEFAVKGIDKQAKNNEEKLLLLQRVEECGGIAQCGLLKGSIESIVQRSTWEWTNFGLRGLSLFLPLLQVRLLHNIVVVKDVKPARNQI